MCCEIGCAVTKFRKLFPLVSPLNRGNNLKWSFLKCGENRNSGEEVDLEV